MFSKIYKFNFVITVKYELLSTPNGMLIYCGCCIFEMIFSTLRIWVVSRMYSTLFTSLFKLRTSLKMQYVTYMKVYLLVDFLMTLPYVILTFKIITAFDSLHLIEVNFSQQYELVKILSSTD